MDASRAARIERFGLLAWLFTALLASGPAPTLAHAADEDAGTAQVAGTVVDVEGRPLAGVPVSVVPVRDVGGPEDVPSHFGRPPPADWMPLEEQRRQAVTDEAGRFRVDVAAEGRPLLVRAAPAPGRTAVARVVSGHEAPPVRLVAARGRWTRLRIVGARGEGLRARLVVAVARTVMAWCADDDHEERIVWHEFTDDEGRFGLAVPADAVLRLTVDMPGRTVHRTLVPSGDAETVVQVIEPAGAVLTGKVVDGEERPLPGARVRVLVSPSETWPPVRPSGVAGVVLGPGGEPARGPTVVAEPLAGEAPDLPRGTGWPDAATGAFRIAPLGRGRYVLRVRIGGEWLAVAPIEVDAPSRGVRLVVPRLHPVEGRVEGWRHARIGACFLPGTKTVRLPATFYGPGEPAVAASMVDHEGRFTIPNRADVPGTVLLTESSGMLGIAENVRPSAGPVRIRLETPLSLKGSIRGLPETLRSHEALEVHLRRGPLVVVAEVSPDGSFHFPRLPEGRYEIEVPIGATDGRIEGPRAIEVKGGVKRLVLSYRPR